MRTVFLGSDPIALPLLDWLADGGGRAHARLAAIYTQPDRPVGRGQKIQPNAIKAWALARNLPVFQPEKLTPAVRDEFAALAPDLALVMAYGHILRDDFIATPRLGTLNLHASLLPAWRGASPIQTAIAGGERETGVSLMRIVRQLDAGPVADVGRVAIAPLDTALDVEQKLAAACVPLLARALPRLREGALSFTPQDDARASYCRRLVKSDGALDFRESAATLAARINGLYPWPACSVEINGQPVKFGLAGVLDAAPPNAPAPGEVLPSASGTLHIATGAGILHVLRLQRPGGKMLPVPDFLRGFPIHPGTILPSTAMPSLAAEPRGSIK
jgi:methionyl-tRNA formyltransferase